MGANSRESLVVLASQLGAYVGDQWALPCLVPQWVAQLQRAMLFAVADADLLALGAGVGSFAIAGHRRELAVGSAHYNAAGGSAHVQTGRELAGAS